MKNSNTGLKWIIVVIITAFTLTLLFGCAKPGETSIPKLNAVEINGKIYDIRYLYIDASTGFYIMIPRDSTQKLPEVMTYPHSNGETITNETVIKIQ